MILPDWLTNLVAKAPPLVGGLAMMLSALLLVLIQDRRTGVLLLLVQYAAVALLTREELFGPLVLVRLATGCAVCGILYVSAQRAERLAGRLAGDESAAGGPREGVSVAFRLAQAGICLLISVGLWRQIPYSGLLQGYGLALLISGVCALMLIVSRTDPLATGIGLMMALHAGSAVYLSLEQSLIAILLLDAFDILVALAVAHMAEAWLSTMAEEDQAT